MTKSPTVRPAALSVIEREAFGFADFCADAGNNIQAVIAEFHRIIAKAGFTCAVSGGSSKVGGEFPVRFYFNSFPDDWMKIVKDRDLIRRGLSANIETFRRMAPFEAFSTVLARGMTAVEREGYDAQQAYGWRTLFAVPFHGPAGYRGSVYMQSKAVIALTPRLTTALHMLAIAVHDRCHADQALGLPAKDPGLSWRETQCLQYVVTGMSDKEIGRQIGISPNTVKDHIDRARLKLNAPSRAAAAAFIVLLGKDN